jgi:hypothetical protein
VAVVAEDKVLGYVLNPNHADGASKARFFSGFGFHIDRWQELADALRGIAQEWPVTQTVETTHGRKYIVEGKIKTPRGALPVVRTVWIVDHGRQIPRVVTAFPQGKRKYE